MDNLLFSQNVLSSHGLGYKSKMIKQNPMAKKIAYNKVGIE